MFASLAFTVALASQVIGAPVSSAVVTSLVLPNTTQTDNATYYLQNGNAGACGLYSQDSDLVVGLPLEFYSATDSVSPYCGSYVVITNVLNNATVISKVEDASATSDVLSLSVATYRALDGDATDLHIVTWRFANETDVAEAKASVVSTETTAKSTVESASSTVDSASALFTTTHTSVASVVVLTPVTKTTTTTTQNEATKSIEYASITSASDGASASLASVQSLKSVQSVQSAQSAQSASYASASSASAASAYYASSASAASVASKAASAAATTKATTVQASTSSSYSGQATYFYQNGQAGACGNVNSDSSYVVALDSAIYDNGSHCGASVVITGNGVTIHATVADECPTCASAYSLDLSVGAFTALASEDAGVASITWYFA